MSGKCAGNAREMYGKCAQNEREIVGKMIRIVVLREIKLIMGVIRTKSQYNISVRQTDRQTDRQTNKNQRRQHDMFLVSTVYYRASTKRLRMVTGRYRTLREVTEGYGRLSGGDQRLREVTGGYGRLPGLREVTEGYGRLRGY